MKRYKYGEYISNIVPCLYYGVACGLVTGGLIFLFKLCSNKAVALSRQLYGLAKGSPVYIIAVLAVLALCGGLMYFLHKSTPECKGGGIPRSEGVLRGVLSFRWLRTLLGTFFGSMLSFLCGVPVGSEGPAVLMGTSVGAMCSRVKKDKTTWSRYVMTGGAGAGFAVATGAPLAGILFALEEIHKRFTPMLVLTVSVSVVSATYINQLLCSFFGMNAALFDFDALAGFQLSHIGYLLLLGIGVAVAVGVFDGSIAVFGKLTKNLSKFLTAPVKLIIVFLASGILCFCFTDGVYSGHDVIHHLAVHETGVLLLIAIIAVRLIMMLFVTDSGATGGIFIPTLAIGAPVAALIAKGLIAIGMPHELYTTIVLLGMCAFIGGTLRAPLTAAVLFVELTGQYMNLLYVALVIFTVSLVTEIFNQTPFYDIALENMEHAQNKDKEPQISYFEMTVSNGAFVVGKAVRDIMWPHASVVVSIKRSDETKKDMDNDGEKKLYAGDTIVVRARYFDEAQLTALLKDLVGKNSDILKTDM